jgi:nitroimidazol reductase NimA-like FMN-containing flavoprotein (pyridoxamine 5'-phosphate oxidase superfamily)
VSDPPRSGALPEWPAGTVGLLVAAGPHAIPISTAVRAGDRRLVFALARRRETLSRLRTDPHAAFALLARGIAFTAYGRAAVVREGLDEVPAVAAVELRVERVQDHLAEARTEILEAVAWRWTEEGASEADRRVVAAIEALARSGRGSA